MKSYSSIRDARNEGFACGNGREATCDDHQWPSDGNHRNNKASVDSKGNQGAVGDTCHGCLDHANQKQHQNHREGNIQEPKNNRHDDLHVWSHKTTAARAWFLLRTH